MYGVVRRQKRGLDSLEQETHAVVTLRVWLLGTELSPVLEQLRPLTNEPLVRPLGLGIADVANGESQPQLTGVVLEFILEHPSC